MIVSAVALRPALEDVGVMQEAVDQLAPVFDRVLSGNWIALPPEAVTPGTPEPMIRPHGR